MYDGLQTFGALVAARAEQHPDALAIKFEQQQLSFAELHRRANRLANALANLQLVKGETCAVMLPNGPDYLTTWLALTRLGVIEVPINVAYRGDLFTYLLNQAECSALVIDQQYLEHFLQISADLPNLRHIVVVNSNTTTPTSITRPTATTTLHDFQDILAHSADSEPDTTIHDTDPSVILFTSGTTGPSKGVVLSHRANFVLARNVSELMGYTQGERLFTVFPLFHVNARYTTVLPAWLVDGDCVMHDRFSASNFLDFCRTEQVTAFNYMGALLMMLMKQPERTNDADNPVRRAYGAPAPVEIYRDFEQRFGVQLVEVYGSTELGTATMNTVDAFRIGSCGKAVPYFEVKIHDSLDNECPVGTEGEIVVRPTRPRVMFDQYYKMPTETVNAFRNLWFHTGDRGRMDEDGYFYFIDRMKDAIRRRGENISSWEVEKVLNTHPKVLETAVIGTPSALTEEEVLVVVVLRDGEALSPVELLDFCQGRMAHFAIPRYVRFVSALPRTPSQRVEKYKLRAAGLTSDTWDREPAGYQVSR